MPQPKTRPSFLDGSLFPVIDHLRISEYRPGGLNWIPRCSSSMSMSKKVRTAISRFFISNWKALIYRIRSRRRRRQVAAIFSSAWKLRYDKAPTRSERAWMSDLVAGTCWALDRPSTDDRIVGCWIPQYSPLLYGLEIDAALHLVCAIDDRIRSRFKLTQPVLYLGLANTYGMRH